MYATWTRQQRRHCDSRGTYNSFSSKTEIRSFGLRAAICTTPYVCSEVYLTDILLWLIGSVCDLYEFINFRIYITKALLCFFNILRLELQKACGGFTLNHGGRIFAKRLTYVYEGSLTHIPHYTHCKPMPMVCAFARGTIWHAHASNV